MNYSEFEDKLKGKLKKIKNLNKYNAILERIKQCSKSQKNALWQSLYFLLEEKSHICIQGCAGSGKSYLAGVLKEVLLTLYPDSLLACASTHQAKKVLSKSLGNYDCITLHRLLELKPEEQEDKLIFISKSNSLSVFELDKTLEEPQKDIHGYQFLLIDEVSMVDSLVFERLTKVIPSHIKIIGIGDPYQLSPIYQEDHKIIEKSRFFTDSRFRQVYLTGIMRQSANSPIIQQSEEIRLMQRDYLTPVLAEDGRGIIQYHSVRSFADAYLEKVHCAKDALNHRILAFTNNKVNEINRYIRQQVYQTDKLLIENELLILQEPARDPDKHEEILINNSEILEVITLKPMEKLFFFSFSKQQLTIPYFQIEVRVFFENEKNDRLQTLNIISDEKIADTFKQALNIEALQLKLAKRQGLLKGIEAKMMWDYWWKDRSFFINAKPIFASTVHKAQGATLDCAFVYTTDFQSARNIDLETYYQLLYVAITRAKNQVHFV